ncbi:hypothetical protein C0991_000529 [Blastosporella zonata]|nr:hypothetical protein C0991_000529 [Blastosporella zonata]
MADPYDVSLSAPSSQIYIDSASSMVHINSQLMAHGFVAAPGIVFGDISNADSERIVKCLLGMLSQRVEDMARTEELTTNLRTLTYDHERLRSLHRDATENAANAEREMNLHKSRLTAATRQLQASEAAHKQTTAELQRTRTMLLGVRATHQTELKKKEKDIERMSEKWSKIADAQVKLMTVPSGLRCANLAVMTGSERIGNRSSFLEVALEEAEKARSQLAEDNRLVRNLVLTAVNEVQSALHHARPHTAENSEQPTPFTITTLFPLHPVRSAGDKVNTVLNNLKDTLTALLHKPNTTHPNPTPHADTSLSEGEIKRLQGVITVLQEELGKLPYCSRRKAADQSVERSRTQIATQTAETRAMFDKFAEDHRVVTGDIGEMSVELMSAPLRDAERDRLVEIKKELDRERQKFTEAAIELGKERAEIQAERIRLLDEKRSWQVQMILDDLPPTPIPATSAPPPRVVGVRQSPKKSPRKSPAKIRVGKAGSSTTRKTTRVSRRSSLVSPSKILPAYETEVLPPLPALIFNPKPLPGSLLPTSFVLPPPSPHASLPTQPAILASEPSLDLYQESSTTPHSQTQSPPEAPSETAAPSTPPAAQRLFPVAKPFAQRMIHAYSPAKPSPLSRILMLGNSPNSPEMVGLGPSDVSSLLDPVVDEEERVSGFEELQTAPSVQMSLAAELGIPESPSESPLHDKKLESNVVKRPSATITAKGRPDPKRFTAQEKGKAKAVRGAHVTVGRIQTSAGVEKENNGVKAHDKVFKAPPRISPPGLTEKKVVKPPPKSTGVSTSRSRLTAKLPPPTRGGPRRVLIDSDEAPPAGKGRKS